MCDVKRFEQIYDEIKRLTPDDTLQLVLEAKDEDTKEFYELIGDYLLQKKQREVIAANLF